MPSTSPWNLYAVSVESKHVLNRIMTCRLLSRLCWLHRTALIKSPTFRAILPIGMAPPRHGPGPILFCSNRSLQCQLLDTIFEVRAARHHSSLLLPYIRCFLRSTFPLSAPLYIIMGVLTISLPCIHMKYCKLCLLNLRISFGVVPIEYLFRVKENHIKQLHHAT